MLFLLGTLKLSLFWWGFVLNYSNCWRRKLMSYKCCQWKTGLERRFFLKDEENICDLCALLIIKDILKASSVHPPFFVVTVQQAQCNLISVALLTPLCLCSWLCWAEHPRLCSLSGFEINVIDSWKEQIWERHVLINLWRCNTFVVSSLSAFGLKLRLS